MSCNYADGLSPYHDKGQLGLDEKFDTKTVVSAKVALLAKWINEAKHVVIHTGAGISTSAGIPDFRGPRGVWTLEAKGEKPDLSTDFNEAVPTVTHMAITKLVEKGKVKYVVSQNIDGLHLRSNLQRKYLSELHGNMFIEQCNACSRQFVRCNAVPTVGQKSLNKSCPTLKPNGRPCRGKLHDCILDWEHNLPENDLGMADFHSCMSDLSICLGTTMQIVPSGNLPLYTKKHGGKLVICNLQPTKHDRKADLLIHAYVDEVMTMLMKNLNLKIPKYTAKNDPTRTVALTIDKFMEWTISDYAVKKMKKIYEEKCGTKEARKRLEMIDDDLPLSISKNLKRTKSKEDEDSDLEVLDVIVKPKKATAAVKESSKRGPKKNSPSSYNATVSAKKVTPPAKKPKYEGEKITIKKNVTPTKTKYEIVQPKPKKIPKCEITYSTDSDVCNDLDMICESDDDDNPPNFTYNFKLYLQDAKKERIDGDDDDKKNIEKLKENVNDGIKDEIKEEIKTEETNASGDESVNGFTDPEKKSDCSEAGKTALEEDEQDLGKNTNLQEGEKSIDDPSLYHREPSEKDVTDSCFSEAKNEEPTKQVQIESDGQTNSIANECEKNDNRTVSIGDFPLEKENNEEIADKAEESKEGNSSSQATDAESHIKAAEKESKDNKTTAVDKGENLQNVIESELSKLTDDSNVEDPVRQLESSLAIPECGISQSMNDSYNFYASEEFHASNTQSDLDYVAKNYYNNF